MPGKMARSAPRPPFGLAAVPATVGTSRLLRQGRNTRILTPVWESSGESRIIWVIGAFMRLYSRMTIVDEGVVGAAFFGGAVRAAAIATEEIGYGH